MTIHPIILGVATLYLALWLHSFLIRKKSKWAFLGWFPFTASCALVVIFWLKEAFSLRSGGGEAEGWYAYGLVMFGLMIVAPCAALLAVSIWFRPRRETYNATVVVATIVCYVLSLICVAAILRAPHRQGVPQSLYSIRLRMVDEAGVPLSDISILGGSTDSNGVAVIQATKTSPTGGQFSSWKSRVKTKLVNFVYTYDDSPKPHITANYYIWGCSTTSYRAAHEEYPYQEGVTDITVVLERCK